MTELIGLGLVRYDAMVTAIAKCYRVDEVKGLRDKARALEVYAKQARNLDAEIRAAEIRIRAERRAGELLKDMAKRKERHNGHGGDQKSQSRPATVKLKDLNITKSQSSRWQALARVPEKKFEKDLQTRSQNGAAHVSHNSGENEWYTPKEYIEAARTAMGGIDCDPASSKIANKVVKAETFYTKDDDGLSQSWHGRVWMNPPYAQPLIDQFSEKITEKYEAGEIREACILINNATETAWFQRMLCAASAVCLIRGRIKFIDTHGNPSGAPLQGQTIIYLGKKPDRFVKAFSKFGILLRVV